MNEEGAIKTLRMKRVYEILSVLGAFFGILSTVWSMYTYYSSQTIPARLIVTDVEELDLGVYPDVQGPSITFMTKFSITVYVITSHEFQLNVIDGGFEWCNVTERLGASYPSPDQGVWLTADPYGRARDFIGVQSGQVTLHINVQCSFKLNQTAFRRFNYIPLGKFHFTIEYQDLKTNYKLPQSDVTQVGWLVRPG